MFDGVSERAIDADATRDLSVTITCPGCKQVSKLSAAHLGRRVQCNKCRLQFTADWGEPVAR
jgi:hypothetical protein